MSAPALALSQVSCTFVDKRDPGQRYTAVHDVTLTVGAGEFVSVVGPTGCGKSTLLNVAAGLLAPSTGTVQVFGEPLAGLNRRAGYMFQSESLMPWRTALRNVMAGLEFGGLAPADAKSQAEDWLKRVEQRCLGLPATSVEPGGRHSERDMGRVEPVMGDRRDRVGRR
jgi:NitT/TauT family transport system ATP-binding protein